jgi:hypothetical protein
MQWNFANSDFTLKLELTVDPGTYSVRGGVIYNGLSYTVQGGFVPANGPAAYTAFSFSGRNNPQPDAPNWIAVSGIAAGSPANPSSLSVSMHGVSSQSQMLTPFRGQLNPF